MSEFIFFISALFIFYAYAGYPMILHFWAKLLPRKVRKSPPEDPPSVSVLIAARNEADNIGRRIDNLIAQDYPAALIEIIVVSDGSTDLTGDIVRDRIGSAGEQAIRLIEHGENRGKPAALNAALEVASGEILVFTDVRQAFEPNAISELIANFSDPKVGAVSGELFFREGSETTIKTEMGLYWNIEKWVRRTESRIHSVAGATGAIYAARRELVGPIPESVILDDVLIPMRAVLAGYRTVFDSSAVAWDTVSKDLAQEKKRKVRTLLGNYQLFHLLPGLAIPGRNPIYFQFISHKFLRLLVPFFFIAMMLSALVSADLRYRAFFIVTLVALLLPLIEKSIPEDSALRKLCSISKTFTSLNYFAFLAFWTFIRPGKKDLW